MALEAKPSTKQTKNPLTKPISKFVGNLFGTCDRQWQDLPAITLLCDFANPCEKFPPPPPLIHCLTAVFIFMAENGQTC